VYLGAVFGNHFTRYSVSEANLREDEGETEMVSKLKICYIGLVIALVVVMVATGCSTSVNGLSGADVVQADAKGIVLEGKDNGGKVEVQTGQILVISLASNPTTGYRWEPVEINEAILQPLGEAEFQPQSDLLGAPGVETLRFEAKGAGTTSLKLGYHRPWEEDVELLETFEVEVTVY
jgi:inhibitor of cysteine peptidase